MSQGMFWKLLEECWRDRDRELIKLRYPLLEFKRINKSIAEGKT